ncbi:MAG: sulfite exporter TauE/SafE family protein [Acidobacteriota bacterium]|nr:sulfite exporter TauE/SafE family protein [Acidobacteriota bacterium]
METGLTSILSIIGAGVVAGFFNVTAGGGSTLTLPLLMILLGLPGPVANGTNRIAIIIQNLVAAPTFRRGGIRGLRYTLPLIVAALPGAAVGAWWGATISDLLFRRLLAGIMVGLAAVIALTPRPDPLPRDAVPTRYRPLTYLAFLGIGLYAGFVQAGVGFLMIFALAGLETFPLVRVHAFKVTIVLALQLAVLPIFLAHATVIWSVGLYLAIGLAAGGYLGARTALAGSERLLRVILACAAVGMAIKLLVDTGG